MYKLFPLPISNSCSILKSSLEGKLYPEEVGTDFRRHHDKTHTGLGLIWKNQQTVRATKDSIVTLCEYANE